MHVLSDKKKSAMMAQNSENTLKLGTAVFFEFLEQPIARRFYVVCSLIVL